MTKIKDTKWVPHTGIVNSIVACHDGIAYIWHGEYGEWGAVSVFYFCAPRHRQSGLLLQYIYDRRWNTRCRVGFANHTKPVGGVE